MREALVVARSSATDDLPTASRDLLLHCYGFCAALGGHHRGEDTHLFPELTSRHPELVPTIAQLTQDHAMIAYLLTELEAAVEAGAPPAGLERHLEGVAAIMESHFRYEERQLQAVLADLDLDAPTTAVLGPL